MPEMDGYTGYPRDPSRARGRADRIPIIALTADVTMEVSRAESPAAGMDDYVTKPIDPEELAAALDRFLPTAVQPADRAVGNEPGSEDPIDHAVLNRLRKLEQFGAPGLVKRLTDIFLQDTARLLTDLRSSAQQGDADRLRKLAHALKGSAANLGAREMVRICAELEALGENGDIGGAPSLVADLESRAGSGPRRPSLENRTRRAMRIVIAEDDTVSRLVLEAAVTALGHECLTTVDGEDAWQLFQGLDVDVVISDRAMPRMGGIELCRRVRAQDRGAYTYFIFLTALDEKLQILSGMEAGADDYLVKPLDIDELKMRLLVASRVTTLHRQLFKQSAELEELNRRLLQQSRTDALTQVGNRLKLREDLETICERVERYQHSYSVIMCDIDCFKAYNDSQGHLAGDEVLRAVATILANTCRGGDQVYRYGGEEFLVLVPEQSLDNGAAAAERYRSAVEELGIPHIANTAKGIVTISAGVASLSPSDIKSVDAWLNEADAALYRAKQSGRRA